MGIVVTCPSCRYTSKVPDEYAGREVICPQCGNALKVPGGAAPQKKEPSPAPAPGPAPTTPAADTRNCPSCGRSVARTSSVCIWCGKSMEEQPVPLSESQPGAVPAASTSGLDSLDATRPCPYCAETIKVAARKCHHCGEILDAQLAAKRRATARASRGQTAAQNLDKMARDAFILSLVALLCSCLAIILGPIAIIQGANVNKQLTQMGKQHNGLATAAVVLGIISLVVFVAGIIIQAASGAFDGM